MTKPTMIDRPIDAVFIRSPFEYHAAIPGTLLVEGDRTIRRRVPQMWKIPVPASLTYSSRVRPSEVWLFEHVRWEGEFAVYNFREFEEVSGPLEGDG